jgi:hypothetical protein
MPFGGIVVGCLLGQFDCLDGLQQPLLHTLIVFNDLLEHVFNGCNCVQPVVYIAIDTINAK